MLRLVELHVRKFRDLVDGGPLRFGPGPVFLLGPNGSGKTTLLELIGVLLGDDLGPLFKEEDAVDLSWALEAEGAGETPATRLEMSLSIHAVARSTSTDARTAKRERRRWRASGVLPARSADEQTITFWQDESGAQNFDNTRKKLFIAAEFTREANELGWLFDLALACSKLETELGETDRISERFWLFNKQLFAESLRRFDEALVQFDLIAGSRDQAVEIEEIDEQINFSHDLPNWVLSLLLDKTIRFDDHPDLIHLSRLLGAEGVEFRPRLVSDDGRGRRRWRGFDIYVHWGAGAIHHHSTSINQMAAKR